MATAAKPKGLNAQWVIHDGADKIGVAAGKAEVSDEADAEAEEAPDRFSPEGIRKVSLRLETAVPTGCQVTVELNGQPNVMRPRFGCRHRKGPITQEKKFVIAPLRPSMPALCASKESDQDVEATQQSEGKLDETAQSVEASGAEEDSPPLEPEAGESHDEDVPPTTLSARSSTTSEVNSADDEEVGSNENSAPHSIVPEKAAEGSGCASFAVTVTLDTAEVNARTTQELQEPEVDVVEVLDTAVVLRMSKLTGEHFELTVYASGASDALGGAAATLIQRGPVRTPDSVHRIGQLESSQVYVAWVRVFCDNKVMESRQKGFKTLPARVKTIWDEPDHDILGVPADAGVKEITRAWRLLSLKYHPDKETDPDKKDAAEEMMKRLNLAKQNMLKCASPDGPGGSPSTAAPSSPGDGAAPEADPATDPQAAGDGFGNHRFGAFSSDSSDDDWPPDFMQQRSRSSFSPEEGQQNGPTLSEQDQKETLRCSLRVQSDQTPKLNVLNRSITTLDVEASGLTIGCGVEVQAFIDGAWKAVVPRTVSTAPIMKFTLEDLEENTSYRLRLRTMVELEPLCLLFAEFAEEKVVPEPSPEPNPAGPDEEEPDAVFTQFKHRQASAQRSRFKGRNAKLDPVSEGEAGVSEASKSANETFDQEVNDREDSEDESSEDCEDDV